MFTAKVVLRLFMQSVQRAPSLYPNYLYLRGPRSEAENPAVHKSRDKLSYQHAATAVVAFLVSYIENAIFTARCYAQRGIAMTGRPSVRLSVSKAEVL